MSHLTPSNVDINTVFSQGLTATGEDSHPETAYFVVLVDSKRERLSLLLVTHQLERYPVIFPLPPPTDSGIYINNRNINQYSELNPMIFLFKNVKTYIEVNYYKFRPSIVIHISRSKFSLLILVSQIF